MKDIITPEERKAADQLLSSLDASTCNFLAVNHIEEILDAHGFERLYERDSWELCPGGKYYVVKNDSAIFPFIMGAGKPEECGLRIISAHSDSPCFKLKPNCEIYGDGGMVSLNVEKYGGGILYTWFDRPLSISGRVMLRTDDPLKPESRLVDLKTPVATIPHLAIHFNRQVNEGNKLSVQKDMKPVVGYFPEEDIRRFKEQGGVILSIIADFLNSENDDTQFEMPCRKIKPEDILDYELALYPAEKAGYVGIGGTLFQSARIDDLSMAYAALDALLRVEDTPCRATRIVAIFDNEETGSGTKQGAASPVLRHIAERIALSAGGDAQAFQRMLAGSFMISADDAHAWHPNYNEKYDPTNHPVIGGGPVVKINANCKYMTDAKGAAVFHALCEKAGVRMQYFVNHADVAGGSTLGNISSSQLDIDGVDVGCAIWAMHSARETASVSDHLDMVKVFTEFLK